MSRKIISILMVSAFALILTSQTGYSSNVKPRMELNASIEELSPSQKLFFAHAQEVKKAQAQADRQDFLNKLSHAQKAQFQNLTSEYDTNYKKLEAELAKKEHYYRSVMYSVENGDIINVFHTEKLAKEISSLKLELDKLSNNFKHDIKQVLVVAQR